MTFAELKQLFREQTDDLGTPYLHSDTSIATYADLAEKEACERSPLLMTSSNETLCNIAVTSGISEYAVNEAVCRVFYSQFITASETHDVYVTNYDEIGHLDPFWKDLEGSPKFLILEHSHIKLVPTPEEDGTLHISVSHIPLTNMSVSGSPSIKEIHHIKLLDWMLHLAFSKRDADTFNAKRALDHEGSFDSYFGERKDANKTKSVRTVREDRPSASWI